MHPHCIFYYMQLQTVKAAEVNRLQEIFGHLAPKSNLNIKISAPLNYILTNWATHKLFV